MYQAVDKVYIVFESVIAVLAILGNILVIWVVRLNPAFQKTTVYFVISLALADIAVGLVVPVAIVASLKINIAYDACLFMCCLLMIFTQASILSLLAIAIDRYLMVRMLTRYRTITSQKTICVALAAIWLLSLVVGFVPMFGWAKDRPRNSSDVACQFTNMMQMQYIIYLSFFSGTLIPLIVMCVLYTKIFCIIRTKLRLCSMNAKGQGIFYRQEFRIAKSLTLVLFLFVVCWLPLCILNCITHFSSIQIPQYVIYMGILLSHSNSAMNPFVYVFRIKTFRETCIQILRTYMLCMDPEQWTCYSDCSHQSLRQETCPALLLVSPHFTRRRD
ncbi:adenosine receptor A3-like [Rhineura floridana]|uniref:adenosine receptor A3-like n=1 Tax=Rhineura floridana TaxID=261503 RepID=UPI002AC88028|nr:adenosine receptor A3-like [Rhineura floridana]